MELGARLGSDLLTVEEIVPTGLWTLDYPLLRVGGIPQGRQVEMFGEYSTGKSLVLYRMLGAAQRRYPDRIVGVVDSERSLQDREGVVWLQRQGVDLSRVAIFPSSTLEDAFDTVYTLVREGRFSMIGIDSLAELYPEEMPNATEAGTSKTLRRWGQKRAVAADARAVTEFMKVIVGECNTHRTTLVWINQVRDKVDTTGRARQAAEEVITTPGGNAFRHAMSVRIYMYSGGDLTIKVPGTQGQTQVIGKRIHAKVIKSKVGPHGAKTGVDTPGPFEVCYGLDEVIDETMAVIHSAGLLGLVVQSGSWFTYTPETGDPLKAQGLVNLRDALRATYASKDSQETLLDRLRAQVEQYHREQVGPVNGG